MSGAQIVIPLPGEGQTSGARPEPRKPAPGPGPRVIGLDLAAGRSGVALPDGTTLAICEPKIKGKRTLLADLDRMDHITSEIERHLREQPVDLAVIEDYTPGIRSAAAHRLAEISGNVRLACHRAGAAVALVNTMHLKIYATGTAKAEKRDMSMAAYKRTGLEFPTDDECDAWWLRAMGLDRLGHPLVAMPKNRRAALDKVAWPDLTRRETN
ncbi:hypothetical protein [Actinomadura sp. GTD37]|uniref:hypothetical protein n=1 Tax=Actinomadura sp. GTD37 TaxID=1778030 RepID=UPI0035BEC9AA